MSQRLIKDPHGFQIHISSSPNLAPSQAHAISTNSPMAGPDWRVDDNELAADFDGSMSGLGVDIAGIPFNMSEALLALPTALPLQFNSHQIGFQYVLSAPTSRATKMNEETLTYLNQGQPYELKVKRVGVHSQQSTHKFYKSYLKVFFHERRLQFSEREQLDHWTLQRPGERFLDIDAPLTYGVLDYTVDPQNLNTIDFVWENNKDCGVFIKVNCISTEFTPKKHGGEKGVPFRIQIDTFLYSEDEQKLLNCAAAQIKVFKPKGADRKQKTDREKVDRLSQAEREKYQPSYDVTVFTETPLENSIASHALLRYKHSEKANKPDAIQLGSRGHMTPTISGGAVAAATHEVMPEAGDHTPPPLLNCGEAVTSIGSSQGDSACPSPLSNHPPTACITPETSEAELMYWLNTNRFTNYMQCFRNFTGADILTLSRDELVSICGIADGIRLNNCLQSRQIRPKVTIYVNIQSETVYHAIYLYQASCHELIAKMAALFKASSSLIVDVHMIGANNIHILVNDDVVANLPDSSQYIVEVLKNENAEQYRVVLTRTDIT